MVVHDSKSIYIQSPKAGGSIYEKNLFAFLMSIALLFTPLSISTHALSASPVPLDTLNTAASPVPAVADDPVIHFPDPNFEAKVRDQVFVPEGDIRASDVAHYKTLTVHESNITDLTVSNTSSLWKSFTAKLTN